MMSRFTIPVHTESFNVTRTHGMDGMGVGITITDEVDNQRCRIAWDQLTFDTGKEVMHRVCRLRERCLKPPAGSVLLVRRNEL